MYVPTAPWHLIPNAYLKKAVTNAAIVLHRVRKKRIPSLRTNSSYCVLNWEIIFAPFRRKWKYVHYGLYNLHLAGVSNANTVRLRIRLTKKSLYVATSFRVRRFVHIPSLNTNSPLCLLVGCITFASAWRKLTSPGPARDSTSMIRSSSKGCGNDFMHPVSSEFNLYL